MSHLGQLSLLQAARCSYSRLYIFGNRIPIITQESRLSVALVVMLIAKRIEKEVNKNRLTNENKNELVPLSFADTFCEQRICAVCR